MDLNSQSPQPPVSAEQLVNHRGLGAVFSPISEEEALELARSRFGIDGRLLRLTTEKDDTFKIDAVDGQSFVLKIANPAEDADEISLQVDLMMHVQAVDRSIPVPRVIPATDGHPFLIITDSAGQRRCARITTYISGILLDSTDANPHQRCCVGQILGRLRHAMATFRHPAAARTLAWNILHLMSLRDLLDNVPDDARRDKLRCGMHRFATIETRVLALRRQVLHNDFSKSNIVVDHADANFVQGIIDFGDAVHTAIAIDVSTALLNQLPRTVREVPAEDFFSDARDVLKGYLSVADLTEEELRLLPHLVMGRILARALITHWRAMRFPENSAYIMRNTEPGWAQLDWLLQRSDDELSSVFV